MRCRRSCAPCAAKSSCCRTRREGGKTQTRNLYGDLEKRLAALETLGGVGRPPVRRRTRRRQRGAAACGGGGEQASYDAAFAALKGGDYDKAIATFREVVTNYPDSALASNAQYWLGESYYVTGRSRKRRHRLSSKVTDRLAGFAQGARRAGQARLLAVGPEAQRRGAHHARGSGAQVIRAPRPRSSPRIG